MNTTVRDSEIHPRGRLSVQASSMHYCSPREDYTDLDMYDAVEVGLYVGDSGLTRPSATLTRLQRLLPFLPRTRQARKLDRLFEDGSSPVAGYVAQDDVDKLRKFLGA